MPLPIDRLPEIVTHYIQHRPGISRDELIRRLSGMTKDGKGAWAREHGLSPQYLSDVINGRRDPGPKILAAMGYEAETRYHKLTTAHFKGGGILP